ncbi:MAG: GNAT family N-acetyltransferase [Nanoarchaeota archaeon]|nr:GNAT family N-acetyltransferase [Nanoarchaeota archaeon]
MGFDYSFRFAEDRRDILKLERFILQQPLKYPHFGDWVYRAREDLLSGWKKSILAFSEDFLIGDLIFQPHKSLSGNLELKNMRVHRKLQGRYFGVFMLKQAEVEARGKYNGIICDTHSDNYPMINLLRFMGYDEIARAPLYNQNVEEIVMMKNLVKAA